MASNPPDVHASQVPQIWAAIGVTYALAVAFIGLRAFARRLLKNALWLDDWLLLASLASSTALLIVTKFSIDGGLGRHLASFPPDSVPNVRATLFKFLFDGWTVWTVTMTVVKFSVLAFYWRIFKHTSISVPIIALASTSACWGIATIILVALQCPDESDGSCRTVPEALFYCSAIIHIVTDASILALPLFYVFSTQRPLAEKFGIAAMFMLGSLVVVIAIIRIIYLNEDSTDDPDVTWTFVNVAVWTNVECSVAIISACLPCLRPVWRWLLTGSPRSIISPNTSHRLRRLREQRLHIAEEPRGAVMNESQHSFGGTSHSAASGEALTQRTPSPRNFDFRLSGPQNSHYRSRHASDNVTDSGVAFGRMFPS